MPISISTMQRNPTSLGIKHKHKLNKMAVGTWKPLVVILLIYFTFSVGDVLLKAALAEGVNDLVIVTYRQTISALFLGPLAYFLERNNEAKLTFTVLCYLFISALLGVALAQYVLFRGLQMTSVSFSSAFINLVPASTFLLAVLFRQEKLKEKSRSGKAKVMGSLVCVGGVVILALYRGFPLSKSEGSGSGSGSEKSTNNDLLGSILYTSSYVLWTTWFIIQGKVCKMYPCKYSTTALVSALSSIQSALLCVALNRDFTIWVLHGKIQIIAVLFAGIVLSGLCYLGMAWCVEKKGAVFTAAFSPSMQIFVSVLGHIFLHEQIFFGSVVGSVVVCAGLYILLWGKSKENEHAAAAAEMKPLEEI